MPIGTQPWGVGREKPQVLTILTKVWAVRDGRRMLYYATVPDYCEWEGRNVRITCAGGVYMRKPITVTKGQIVIEGDLRDWMEKKFEAVRMNFVQTVKAGYCGLEVHVLERADD